MDYMSSQEIDVQRNASKPTVNDFRVSFQKDMLMTAATETVPERIMALFYDACKVILQGMHTKNQIDYMVDIKRRNTKGLLCHKMVMGRLLPIKDIQ